MLTSVGGPLVNSVRLAVLAMAYTTRWLSLNAAGLDSTKYSVLGAYLPPGGVLVGATIKVWPNELGGMRNPTTGGTMPVCATVSSSDLAIP